MKKRLIVAVAVAACVSISFTSCQPDKPEYVKKFRMVQDDEMLCPPEGDDCAYFDGHHMYKPDQVQTEFEAASRLALLNTFYRDAAQNNVRRFFEHENWQSVFPPEILNPTIVGEIANANYATLIVPGDSSIMFVHRQDGGMVAQNLIYAFKRTDIRHQIDTTIVP
jgi:hypothetical protein